MTCDSARAVSSVVAQPAPMQAWLACSPFGLWCALLFPADSVALALDYAAVARLPLR